MSINELCELLSKYTEDFVINEGICPFYPNGGMSTYAVVIIGKDIQIRNQFTFSYGLTGKFLDLIKENVIEELYNNFLNEYNYVKSNCRNNQTFRG